MELPNIELLGNILKVSIYKAKIIDNYLIYDYENGMPLINQGKLSIYELMHMMKAWARYNHGISVSSTYKSATVNNKSFYDDTEFEAVTKACEWVLEQQNEH